jgi:hypothetical protein
MKWRRSIRRGLYFFRKKNFWKHRNLKNEKISNFRSIKSILAQGEIPTTEIFHFRVSVLKYTFFRFHEIFSIFTFHIQKWNFSVFIFPPLPWRESKPGPVRCRTHKSGTRPPTPWALMECSVFEEHLKRVLGSLLQARLMIEPLARESMHVREASLDPRWRACGFELKQHWSTDKLAITWIAVDNFWNATIAGCRGQIRCYTKLDSTLPQSWSEFECYVMQNLISKIEGSSCLDNDFPKTQMNDGYTTQLPQIAIRWIIEKNVRIFDVIYCQNDTPSERVFCNNSQKQPPT